MLYAKQKVERSRTDVVVIPRQTGDIIISAAAVTNYDDFEKLCPLPKPPEIIRKGGERSVDPNDPDYENSMQEWGKKRFYYMIIQSLSVTEDLEWEKVDPSDPDTWENVDAELQEAFSDLEFSKIVSLVTKVNGLDEDAIEKATKDFLATAQAQ